MMFKNPPRAKRPTFWLTGGIGDMLLSVPAILEFQRLHGPCDILTKHHYEASTFFLDQQFFPDEEFQKTGLDWYIHMATVPKYCFSKNFNGWSTDMDAAYLAHRGFASKEPWKEIVTYFPFLDNIMGQEASELGVNRWQLPYLALGLKLPKFQYRQRVIDGSLGTRYITVHDGFDSAQSHVKTATKTWAMKHWKEFVYNFKRLHPDIAVVQIGGPKSRAIPYVDKNFCGIDFRSSVKFLQSSVCHVDGDSGLVHAAHILGVKSVVMFGPTPANFFGYEYNTNIEPDYCGGCWWLKKDWMAKCPSGYEEAECMASIDPTKVYSAVKTIIERNL